jgi:RNA polymerase sigma-70 factor (ECF subfamily)
MAASAVSPLTHSAQWKPPVSAAAAAFVYYVPDPSAPIWRASGLMVIALAGNQVCGLTRFAGHGPLARFGFPRTLPRD